MAPSAGQGAATAEELARSAEQRAALQRQLDEVVRLIDQQLSGPSAGLRAGVNVTVEQLEGIEQALRDELPTAELAQAQGTAQEIVEGQGPQSVGANRVSQSTKTASVHIDAATGIKRDLIQQLVELRAEISPAMTPEEIINKYPFDPSKPAPPGYRWWIDESGQGRIARLDKSDPNLPKFRVEDGKLIVANDDIVYRARLGETTRRAATDTNRPFLFAEREEAVGARDAASQAEVKANADAEAARASARAKRASADATQSAGDDAQATRLRADAAKAAQLSEKAAKQHEAYKADTPAVNQASEKLGVSAANEVVMADHPNAVRVLPDKIPSRSAAPGEFDAIYRIRGAAPDGSADQFIIPEAKGGSSGRGTRMYKDPVSGKAGAAEQGSQEYFKSVVENMKKSKDPEIVKLASELEQAMDRKAISYLEVRAEIVTTGGQDALGGIAVTPYIW